jgi:hypothetical protein
MNKILKQDKAQSLRVVVIRDGEEKVNLQFPIHTLSILGSIMPQAIIEKLSETNFDLKDKINKIIEGGTRPQTIFEMSNQEKSYKVWIE